MPCRDGDACPGSISTSLGRAGFATGVDSASTKLANWWPMEVPRRGAGVGGDDVDVRDAARRECRLAGGGTTGSWLAIWG